MQKISSSSKLTGLVGASISETLYKRKQEIEAMEN